ncbi:MAG: BatD family protein [Phycisphaeraceae bacterium]|nr:MAG: BatD family protein [Phycisphaeraceae bacterium]
MTQQTIFILIAALASLLATSARAQEPSISVQVNTQSIFLDTALTVVIKIERLGEAFEARTPEFDPTDEFLIGTPFASRGSFTEQTISNGVIRRDVRQQASFQYQMQPTRTGTLTVPSASITIGNAQYRTNPVQILVSPRPTADFATLRIEPRTITAYVGQAIPLDVIFESSRMPDTGEFIGDSLPRGIIAIPGKRRPTPNDRTMSIPLLGATGTAFNLPGYTGPGIAFTMPMELIAENAGTWTVGPITFMLTLDRSRPHERLAVASNPLNLEIRPLPDAGRPSGFSGIVGEGRIEASLSTPTARIGDPINLTIRLSGALPADRLHPPRIELQHDIAEQFRIGREGWVDGGVSGDSRTYSITVRPQSSEISEFPPIRLHWFDPSSATYKMSLSRAIPLKIEASREVTAADAVGRFTPGARESLGDAPLRLNANRSSSDRLTNYDTDLDGFLSSQAGRALLIAPPSLWALLWAGTAIHRRESPDARRRRRMLSKSLSLARRAGSDPARATDAVRIFVAAHTGIAPEAVTSADLAALGTSSSTPELALLTACMKQAEGFEHTGRSVEPTPGIREAMQTLSRTLRKGSEAAS